MSGYKTLSSVFYLAVSEGRYGSVKARLLSAKHSPALNSGEVAIRLDLSLPGALFVKPMLEAKVIVPEDRVTPMVLEAQVIENVREAIAQQTGMHVTVALVEAAKP